MESTAKPTQKLCPETVLSSLVESQEFELPLLPETVPKLLRICNDQEHRPCELAECIRNDQSIASHVLRIANSAMYGMETPIVSLRQAVARLGLFKIRDIVIIVSCQGRVFAVDGFEEDVRLSFRRSLATASFAQEIARAQRVNVEEAFLCGLLHDIGRPVLLQAIADFQTEQKIEFDREGVLAAVERFRTAVGGQLIEAWSLPTNVSEAVRNQKNVANDAANDSARQLNLAIALTDAFMDPTVDAHDSMPEHPMVSQLNLYPEDLNTILSRGEEALDLIECI